MAGKILNVTFSESSECLYVCIIRRCGVEILFDWVALGKDDWNSEGRMSTLNGQVTLKHFSRNELMSEIYTFYKEEVGIYTAKQNMSIFAKYIDMEKTND